MFSIDSTNKITMSWGDNVSFGINIKPEADDILQLNVYDSVMRIQREADIIDGRFVFSLDVQDVADVPAGLYSYIVKLLRGDEQYTVIWPSTFELVGGEPQDDQDEQDDEND